MSKTIVVNIEKCLACQNCELACAVVHSQSKKLEESIHETPRPQAMITLESSGKYVVPIQCRHCQDAPCITVCPTAAIHRDGAYEPVLINTARCIGCRYCVTACPFGAIDMTRDGKAVTKCDLCIQRTKAGQLPACVESCSTGALKYEDVSDVVSERRAQVAYREASSICDKKSAPSTPKDEDERS